jgi:hypothetical protein
LNLNHHSHLFTEPFFDFFDTSLIDSLIREIGFSSFYFQAYGASRLLDTYKNSDFLLTGSDGYFIGLFANKKLFSLTNKQELVNYIFEKNGTILSPPDCGLFTNLNIHELENGLRKKIEQALPEEDYISAFFDWTIKNRLRKYILSIHEILNRNTTILYPYYDYEFIDLMLSMPYEHLANQQAYVNAMFNYGFTGNLQKLGSIPFQGRLKRTLKNDILLINKKPSILKKIVKRLFSLPEMSYTYPMYKTYRFHRKKVTKLIIHSLADASDRYNPDAIKKLIKKKKRNEHFFRYGIIAILSVIRFELLLTKRTVTNQKARE